jgi:hypothetical protein
MGYLTCIPCDGHGLYKTYISFSGKYDTERIAAFLSQKSGVRWVVGSDDWRTVITFAYGARGRGRRDRRYDLLSLAESLNKFWVEERNQASASL